MNVMELNVAGNKFANNNDHSKWAIGTNDSKPLVCIGDINRQVSGFRMKYMNFKLFLQLSFIAQI